jgi:hypothetical protein
VLARRRPGAHRLGDLGDGGVLGGEIAWEGVDGYDRGHAVQPHVLDLLAEIGPADVHLFRVLLVVSGVSSDRSYARVLIAVGRPVGVFCA